MGDVLHVSVPNGGAVQVWSNRQAGINSLLFINQDLNNYVYLGQTSNITPGGPNTIPLAPNGTFSGDAASAWYVTGSAAGILPLVVVPNGQAYFLGITQGLGNLAIPSMQNPGFETGVSGWQIDKNGNAEFNNVVVRGTVESGQFIGTGEGLEFILYSGTPAANNVIASIVSSAAVDSNGNHILAGTTNYGKSGATYYAVNQLPGIDHSNTFGALVTVYTGASQAAWTAGTQLNLEGSNGLGVLADVMNIYGISGAPLFQLHSGSALLSPFATVTANAQGVLVVEDESTFTGALPMVQADVSTHGPGNTATAADITKSWPVPANDGVKGTTYTIKCVLIVNTGQTTIQTLTLGVDIDGTQTALATLGAAFNGGALNTIYVIPLELVLMVDAVGTALPEIYINGPGGDASANRLATNSVNMSGFTHAASWDRTISHTLAIYAQWGGTGGSAQSAQALASRLYREGP